MENRCGNGPCLQNNKIKSKQYVYFIFIFKNNSHYMDLHIILNLSIHKHYIHHTDLLVTIINIATSQIKYVPNNELFD